MTELKINDKVKLLTPRVMRGLQGRVTSVTGERAEITLDVPFDATNENSLYVSRNVKELELVTPALSLEVGKSYRTRDGRKARVICVDAKGIQPVVALTLQTDTEFSRKFNSDGTFLASHNESDLDLISPWRDIPEVGEGWRLLCDSEVPLSNDELWIEDKQVWGIHGWAGWAAGRYTVAEINKYNKTHNDVDATYFRRRILPLVSWADMPRWAKFVSMDSNGDWFWWDTKPSVKNLSWQHDKMHEFSSYQMMIPPEFQPSFSGSWKDSLVERKEGV